jgi:hypothetical protein
LLGPAGAVHRAPAVMAWGFRGLGQAGSRGTIPALAS